MDDSYLNEINWEEEEGKNRPSVRAAAAELASAESCPKPCTS